MAASLINVGEPFRGDGDKYSHFSAREREETNYRHSLTMTDFVKYYRDSMIHINFHGFWGRAFQPGVDVLSTDFIT